MMADKYQELAGSEISDRQIIEETLNGETPCFEVLIRRYNTRLYRIGIGYLKNEQDVQDAMQNAYLKAFENLSGFHYRSSFSTWLVQIMINECLMVLRKRKREVHNENMPEMPEDPQQVSTLANQEMKEIFEQAILRLPQQYRSIYVFREVEHFSTKETAEMLELSPENVKVRLHRSKEMLKEDLFTRLGREELFAFYRPKCDVLTGRVMKILLAGKSGHKFV